MAKESIDMSLSPELTKPRKGDIRRSSTGTPFFLSNGKKPVPHYLRASIGSCHDFCKYGRKHAFEAKERSPVHKINITSRPPDDKNPLEKVIQAERKKASIAKLKPSSNSKAGFPQIPKIVKLEVSSPSEKVEVSLKHPSANARGITNVASTTKKVDASSKQAPPNSEKVEVSLKHASANARGITDVASTMKKVDASSKKAPPNSEKVEVSLKHASANARGITDVASTMKKVDASSKQAPPNSEKVEVSLKHASANARGITDVASTMKKVDASSKQAPTNSEKVKVSLKHASANARGITDVASTMKKVDASSKQAPTNSEKVEVSLKRASANARGITDVASTMKKVDASSKQAPTNSEKGEVSLKRASANARGITDVASTMKKVDASSKKAPTNSEKAEVSLKHASANARGITDVASAMKKVDASSKQAPPNARVITRGTKHMTPVKLKPMTVKGSSGRRNSDINLGQKTGTSKVAVKQVLVSSAARLSPKPSVDVATKHRSSDAVSPLKNQNRIRKAEPQKPKNSKIKEKTLRATLFSKPSINRAASLNARMYKSMKVVSPLKNLNRNRKADSQPPDDEVVIEKTLYVVKVDTDNKTLGSSPYGRPAVKLSPSPLLLSSACSSQPTSPSLSSQEEEDQEKSEYTISDADESILEDSETENINEVEVSEEEDNKSKNMNEAENSEGEYKKRPQKAGMVRSEAKDRSAVKLNFRRGKVLDVHSESKGPRRLRFRRGRLLGENQNGNNDAGRRSFKRRVVDGDTNGAKDESEKVVLRHQGVQGKKDAQGLLNNVIEETASKLVETRKSKVKALVGAFETVISLQETKPATYNVT